MLQVRAHVDRTCLVSTPTFQKQVSPHGLRVHRVFGLVTPFCSGGATTSCSTAKLRGLAHIGLSRHPTICWGCGVLLWVSLAAFNHVGECYGKLGS